MSLKESIKAAQIDLVKELGINELPKEQREEMLAQMSEVLQQRVVLRIVAELPEDKKEAFASVVNEGVEKPEAIDQFLQENLPNVEELVLDEIGKYKEEVMQFLNSPKDEEQEEDVADEGGE